MSIGEFECEGYRGIGFKGPCTQITDTSAPKYPSRDYFKAKVSTIWIRGPLGEHALNRFEEPPRSTLQ